MPRYNITAKLVSSMEKVFPEREPASAENRNSLFLNERLNFQIAFLNQNGDNFLRGRLAVRGDLSEYVSMREVVLMPAEIVPARVSDDYYLKKESGLYPELLRPISDVLGVVLPPSHWRAFWVSLELPEGASSGESELFFDLFDDRGELQKTLSYTVDVLNEKLERNDMHVTGWMHYDCIANAHDVEPFTPEYYEIFAEYLKAYVECGYNMLLTPLFTPPLDTAIGHERRTCQLVGVTVEKGKYSFDLTALEYFLDFVAARGVEYFEFSHLFTQWGGKACPKIVATVDGEYKKIFGWENDSLSEEYREFLGAFLPELVKLVDRKNLREKVVFHLTDEPHGEHIDRYLACRDVVKKYIGDLPTMDALSDYAFYEKGAVDIPVPITSAMDCFRENGAKRMHAYYCCGPANEYYSNRFVNMPLQRMRIIGWQLYLNDCTGFLHWGFNFYNTQFSWGRIDPMKDLCAGGLFPAGDSFIVYPDGKGVLKSMRAETHREAMQDYRLMKLLEKYYGAEFARGLLEKEGVASFSTYPRSLGWHDDFRKKVNALIKAKLS